MVRAFSLQFEDRSKLEAKSPFNGLPWIQRTTVVRPAAGIAAPVLQPKTRYTISSPVVSVEEKAGTQAGPQLERLRVDPNLCAQTLPPPLLAYTPMGMRSFISAGQGQPTVVFESGLGDGKEIWGNIFNEVSAVTRAFAYDRAGYGASDPSDLQRDGHQVVRELRALLQAEEIKPPYVLVGHSLGGTFVKLFARMYPNEVAGVVLVDARHSEFDKRCKQQGVHRLLYQPPSLLFALSSRATRAELAASALTMRQARQAGPFPPVPLIVLSQGKATSNWPERLGKVWNASQRNLAKMSKLGQMRVCEDSGHKIHQDQPGMVTNAILSVLAAARYAQAKARANSLR
jgi:pimeloyl-ACP methyl ester carboxylesterase